MNGKDFRKYAHQVADWMADYYEDIEHFPVKSRVKPKEIFNQINQTPPDESEEMKDIIADFEKVILPGMTHWQHPNFHAYFSANASYPSILAEMFTSAMAAQCMIWDTSPAAAELEEQMMNWLKDMCGLPAQWSGVIHDGASTATLTALITARESHSNYHINSKGFENQPTYRVYCSSEAHSSIDKAVRISGIGDQNLVKVAVQDDLSMDATDLRKKIADDLSKGYVPLFIVAALGTTGTTAIDPLEEIAEVATEFNIWLHVDAAYSGTALILPEFRWMIKGIEQVDSFVFNPHKWMFTNFDCTAYFVKDESSLIRTFTILPEYLKTSSRGQVNDYRDWGIPMGRRFRALKLWFVIRSFGLKGLQDKIRHHINLAVQFETDVEKARNFEIIAPRTMNVVFFRYHPVNIHDQEQLNQLNLDLLERIKTDGRIFLTHTKVNGMITLRMVIAQTYVEQRHVEKAWRVILELAGEV